MVNNSIYFLNIQVFFQNNAYVCILFTVGKPVRYDIRVGDGNLDILNFFFAKEPKLPGFPADPHNRLFFKLQAVDHNDHPPDTAVPIGGDAAGIVVDCQLFEGFPGDPQAQLLPGLRTMASRPVSVFLQPPPTLPQVLESRRRSSSSLPLQVMMALAPRWAGWVVLGASWGSQL